MSAFQQTHYPPNEPPLEYGDEVHAEALKNELRSLIGQPIEIGPIINGKEYLSSPSHLQRKIQIPHDQQKILGYCHLADDKLVDTALKGALQAWHDWAHLPSRERAAVFLRAAELLTKKYRKKMNALTMLNQSKTCHQSELDSICELSDFWRFHAFYLEMLEDFMPILSKKNDQLNYLNYRSLEGFILAISPFNFTAIGGNLSTAPLFLGNVSLWKPASTSLYSNYVVAKILLEAGLPPGVLQFIPTESSSIKSLFASPHFSGLHFTGSTDVFRKLSTEIWSMSHRYINFPRIVGETGGKDFLIAHMSAHKEALVAQLIRGAFEYQGQKCSAISRAYIPQSLWKSIEKDFFDEVGSISVGDVSDFSNFMGAVIDRTSFERISSILEETKKASTTEKFFGGTTDDSVGLFIHPAIIITRDPKSKTMQEEIFGPVLTIYLYPDQDFISTLDLVATTSNFALTGAIFAEDPFAIKEAKKRLLYAAGNLTINNKPTGATVGQQPFGGSRQSGTNDKAGSMYNLLRWTSIQTVSETFFPDTNYRYPYMG